MRLNTGLLYTAAMGDGNGKRSASVRLSGLECTLTLQPMPLEMALPFGTSHSVTTSRTNALISATLDGKTGYGECGLPPKKKGIYMAGARTTKAFS